MADNITILAKYFGVSENIILKCVELTKKEIGDVSTSDIHACVMESVGIPILPEITGEIFFHIPPEEFLKICTITKKHAMECKKSSYWLKYLSNKSKDDWITVIKHLSPDKQNDDVSEDEVSEDNDKLDLLKEVVSAYQKHFKEDGIELILSVADSYTITELEAIIKFEIWEVEDENDYGFKQVTRVNNIIDVATVNFDKSILAEVKSYFKAVELSWAHVALIGKYLKKALVEQVRGSKKARLRRDIKDLKEVREGEYIPVLEVAIARYFTSFNQVLKIYKILGHHDSGKIAIKLLTKGFDSINPELVRSIVKAEPKVMELLNNKWPTVHKHIQKML